MPMVDQEDIIALTKHVRSFSDALNNLRNSFKDSLVDGIYNHEECQRQTHARLGNVLKILQGILAKYPPLHSPDILSAAKIIINMIKSYDYADGEEGPTDFYTAIDQLALSFSSSVSDFLMGEKANEANEQDEDNEDYNEEYEGSFGEANFLNQDHESERNNESEDSLERLIYQPEDGDMDQILSSTPESEITMPTNVKTDPLENTNRENSVSLRNSELDKTFLSIEGSVEFALKRTKIWSKYSKDLLTYIERRSNYELEFCRKIDNLAKQTKTAVVDESYLPLQSIWITALEHDIEYNTNFHKSYHTTFVPIVENLMQKQKEHDTKRSKIKTRWKAELKKQHDSIEALKNTKKLYIQKEKDLEKFNKLQSEGKDEKGFSIGKKKGQEDFQKGATESEEHYKRCVEDANNIQSELERTKAEVLLQFRQLIFDCDLVTKSAGIAYFQMMNELMSPLPIQCRALQDSAENYMEGQQFSDYVHFQKSTHPTAVTPQYFFEPYKSDNKYSFYRQGGEQPDVVSPNNLKPRSQSNTSETTDISSKSPYLASKKVAKHHPSGSGTWTSLNRTKGSATDDTDSLSSHSLPASPQTSPVLDRRSIKMPSKSTPDYDDDQYKLPNLTQRDTKNRKMSAAAEGHTFRRLHAPSKCKECESYVYFNGQECEQCGIICHKKCLETLAIKCGNKRLPRKMTTFGVDFMQHLASTQRSDIPYIVEKCVNTIDEVGLGVKGIYRVPGVKGKVEKLCQCFETGSDLVDLSNTPPHFIASVLKLYLRQLPEPLMTFKLYQPLIAVAKDSMNLKLTAELIDHMTPDEALQYEEVIRQIHEIIKELPEPNFYTAAKIIRHLRRVAENKEENQMDAGNLAIVFGPTLLRPEGNPNSLMAVMDISHQSRAVELLILNCHIFSHTKDGPVDIETLTGEKRVQSRKKHNKRGKIDTLHEASDELPEDNEANVASEFTSEMLNSFSLDENIVPLSESISVATVSISSTSSALKEIDELDQDVFALSSTTTTTTTTTAAATTTTTATTIASTATVTTIQATPILQSIHVAKATPIADTPIAVHASALLQQMEDLVQAKSQEQTTLQASPPIRTAIIHKEPIIEPSAITVQSEVVFEQAPPLALSSPVSIQTTPVSTPQSKSIEQINSSHQTLASNFVSTASETGPKTIAKPAAPTFISSDYDNVPCFESDILNDDLPEDQDKSSNANAKAGDVSDSDSVYSRFTSIEDLLLGDSLRTSTPDIPVAVLDQEDSDDAWMNKFGMNKEVDDIPVVVTKKPLTQALSTPLMVETAKMTPVSNTGSKSPDPSYVNNADPFSYPIRKKKTASISLIETTSYSFSLGNTIESDSPESNVDAELSAWVKRDSKERVPVRKHLKSVNIKSAITPPLQTESPDTPSFGLKETPFTLNESKGGDVSDNIVSNKNTSTCGNDDNLQQFDYEQENSLFSNPDDVSDSSEMSPSKRAPAVLPKPKKQLDKKSWTADLIKSKSQTMADQPQPGSLNDKLLNINRRKTEEIPTDAAVSKTSPSNRSIREIRTNFATPRNANEAVTESESGSLNRKDEKIV